MVPSAIFCACSATCCWSDCSHWSAVCAVGSWNAVERSCERIVERRQRLEELDAGGEVVDRQARVGFEQDAAGDLDVDEHLERPELGQAEADREAGHPGHREAALDAQVEDALRHRRRVVERADDVVVRVELEDAADEAGVELAAEHLALHLHGDGVDAR